MNATLPTSSSTDRVRIRGYEPGDEAAIPALFSRHTPYRRDEAFWFWLNRSLPVRPSIVAVAELAGAVVGHYGILPLELRLPDGTAVLAGHGVHAFVSPDHRREVGIFQISALAYRLAAEAGVRFVFGFPNPNYRLVQEKIERWRCVSLFKAWTKPAGAAAGSGAKLLPADLGDDRQRRTATGLWDRIEAAGAGIGLAAQARWWNVRYLQHPQRPYQLHWLAVDGETRGLVVTKIFRGEGESRAHIIDFALDGPWHESLLRAFDAAFAGQVDRLVHWPSDQAFSAALQACGYQPDGFETYFGLRPLGGTPLPAGVPDRAAWRLPMGLSDAF